MQSKCLLHEQFFPVIENMDLKEKLYTQLGSICAPNTIFASNTSSLSIGEMAQFSGRPEKFVGVHFFNPVQVSLLGCDEPSLNQPSTFIFLSRERILNSFVVVFFFFCME